MPLLVLTLHSPDLAAPLTIHLPLATAQFNPNTNLTTILQVKREICSLIRFPCEPSSLKLIHGGRFLSDEADFVGITQTWDSELAIHVVFPPQIPRPIFLNNSSAAGSGTEETGPTPIVRRTNLPSLRWRLQTPPTHNEQQQTSTATHDDLGQPSATLPLHSQAPHWSFYTPSTQNDQQQQPSTATHADPGQRLTTLTLQAQAPFQVVHLNGLPYAVPTSYMPYLLATLAPPHAQQHFITATPHSATPIASTAQPLPSTMSPVYQHPSSSPISNNNINNNNNNNAVPIINNAIVDNAILPVNPNRNRPPAPPPPGEGAERINLLHLAGRLVFLILLFGQSKSWSSLSLMIAGAICVFMWQAFKNRRNALRPVQVRPLEGQAPAIQPNAPQRGIVWIFFRSLLPEGH